MRFPKEINIEEVVAFLDTVSTESRVYIGCDSERKRVDGKWYNDYNTVVVVHVDGKHGCKIFGAVDTELDFDRKLDRPSMRLMGEVYRVANLYTALSSQIAADIAVHLDLNKNEIHGSSCVVDQAIGYIRGVCGVEPQVKPHAWCASFAADRLREIKMIVAAEKA